MIDRQPLIYHKKQIYYLLSNAKPDDMLDSERALLAVLQDDIELQAELSYKAYMEGDQ